MRAINEINDPRLIKALAHPLRVSILSALEHRIASPSQLADELEVPLPNLSYHIRMLVQLDLLKLVKTRPRRGAIEHYYKATGPVVVTDEAWGAVPGLLKESMVSNALSKIGKIVDAAAVRGGFDEDPSVLARLSLKLDQKAWEDLSRKMIELHDYAMQLQKDSDKRRKDSNHEDEVDAGAVLMLFKSSPVDEHRPAIDADGRHKTATTRSPARKRQKV